MLDIQLPPIAELSRVRRHLHRHPELSLKEFETASFIERELRALPFDEIRTGIGGTGLLATLRGGRPGPVTLLRADIDALPLQEESATDYRSTIDGVMHACGHDAHVSILLAAAATLCERRADVPGTLVFCFQPGEEGFAGNRLMIDDGALENPHVDRVFALHVFSGLDVGKIGVRDGAFFASSDQFALRLEGKGGHGAMPQFAIDPIIAASHLVTMLQTIVTREVAPKDPAVFSVCSFHAGTTFNVLPNDVEMRGTVRCYDAALRAEMPKKMERIIAGLCDAMRLKYELDYRFTYPATVNDKAMNDLVREVGREVLGPQNVVEHDIVTWGEDMSFMMEQRPGAYFIVGARGGESSAYPHHSPQFDIDERCLETGYRMMVALGLHG
jgi:amidohydrolase